MTKFDELTDIITQNRNKNKKPVFKDSEEKTSSSEHDSLEVAGSEGTKKPIVSFGDDETDPDLLSQLHRSIKTKPNDGSGASSWDSDY